MAGVYDVSISAEDKVALDRAIRFAREMAGDDSPRTPESDGRWIMDIVRCWHRERRDAMTARAR